MANYFAAEIKRSVSMPSVAAAYNLPRGRPGWFRCPFHDDSHASMRVYPGAGGYYCFACGAGGSVLDFVMHYEGCSLTDAEARLDAIFSLGLPLRRPPTREEQTAREARAKLARLEREKAERERAEAEWAYDIALSRWIALDRIARERAPRAPDEAIAITWVEAVRGLAAARYELEIAETRLQMTEKRTAASGVRDPKRPETPLARGDLPFL